MDLICHGCQTKFRLDNRTYKARVRRGTKTFFCNAKCAQSWQSTNLKKESSVRICGSCHLPSTNGRRQCSKCFSSYICRRFNARKLACIEFMGGKCSICFRSFHPAAYHFHHIDPKTKEFDWGRLRMKSVDKVFVELKKTVLICANCHSDHHSGGPNWTLLEKEKNRFLNGLKKLSGL